MTRQIKKSPTGSPHIVASEVARTRGHHPFTRRLLERTMVPIYRRSIGRLVNTIFQMDYIQKTNAFRDFRWQGVPIWQDVFDLWTIQQVICQLRPGLIIETGTFEGGSSLFYANICDLMGHGQVVTIDIDKQHDLHHPRITYLTGRSSIVPQVVEEVKVLASRSDGPVMVILDSDHRADHVRVELESYGPMVSQGSYLLVQDGIIDTLPVPEYRRLRPGPLPAIISYVHEHPEFVVDEEVHGFPITFHPKGWLRRVR